MVTSDPIAPGAAALAQIKDYLRVEGEGEDELVALLLASAAELCERFTGRALLVRGFEETLEPGGGAWVRLERTPVRSITAVDAVNAAGFATALPVASYAIDIDANGDGWVRVIDPGPTKLVRVRYQAGAAADWAAVPEPLAQGAVRLAAHLYKERDEGRERMPPAAVSALWRPYRLMRIGGGGHVRAAG